ncbi:MAG: hypothetical protein ABSE46_12240 [Terracidiphilus sp.]|jgi:hypothetical protein
MQTLNLSGSEKKSDGRLKSLFWPTVENAWDVDYLGQQGFWISLIIGLFSLALIAVTASQVPNSAGRIAVLVLGIVIFFVYLVGGMGVRESSWPAAAMIFTIYVINLLGSGTPPGILSIIIAAVLLSNVRATFIASRWKPLAEGEDRPMRFSETFRDKLVDQLPPRAWPILKIPFFIAASLILVFLLYVSAAGLTNKRVRPAPNENSVPSVVVAPSNSK